MDNKASISINFEVYGQKFHQEWWINYCPDDYGIDARIREWFQDCHDKAHQAYAKRIEPFEIQVVPHVGVGERIYCIAPGAMLEFFGGRSLKDLVREGKIVALSVEDTKETNDDL